MIRPALEEAHVTVQEEVGVVSLLVARAQGLLGRVMVGYRTSPFTAAGSEDYEVPTVPIRSYETMRYQQLNIFLGG